MCCCPMAFGSAPAEVLVDVIEENVKLKCHLLAPIAVISPTTFVTRVTPASSATVLLWDSCFQSAWVQANTGTGAPVPAQCELPIVI